MRGGIWLVVLAIVVVGLGYAGFRAYRGSDGDMCYACKRPMHAHTRTVAVVRGRSELFCCPACALSEHEQEGKPVRVTELTDFATGAKLTPDKAFLVRGSDVNMCARTHELMDADKRAADIRYDRCSPSLLAFASRSAALQFAGQHGGEVLPYAQIVPAFAH